MGAQVIQWLVTCGRFPGLEFFLYSQLHSYPLISLYNLVSPLGLHVKMSLCRQMTILQRSDEPKDITRWTLSVLDPDPFGSLYRFCEHQYSPHTSMLLLPMPVSETLLWRYAIRLPEPLYVPVILSQKCHGSRPQGTIDEGHGYVKGIGKPNLCWDYFEK